MPKDYENKLKFNSYIKKVLKRIHPTVSVDSHALNNFNLMLHHAAVKILDAANTVKNHSTMDSRTLQTGLRLALPAGDLQRNAIRDAAAATTRYVGAAPGSRGAPISRTTRAGLVFPPSLVDNIIRTRGCGRRVGDTASVYLAGALEYLAAELLELSGNSARDNSTTGKARINPRNVMLAVANDKDLSHVFDGVLNGGVLPTPREQLQRLHGPLVGDE